MTADEVTERQLRRALPERYHEGLQVGCGFTTLTTAAVAYLLGALRGAHERVGELEEVAP